MAEQVRLSDLHIRAGHRELVRGAELVLDSGRITALVGASGSGKSLTAKALLGLVDLHPGVVRASYEVEIAGTVVRPYANTLGASASARDRAFGSLRSKVLGWVPQQARQALDPLRTVGDQVERTAGGDPLPWLSRAGFSRPAVVAQRWPHQLSGGMAQRVVIAQALSQGSRFLIADEPTTGLDPSVQQALLQSLRSLADGGLGVLLITHDLRVIPEVADDVRVMDDGHMVEHVPASTMLHSLQSAAGRRLLEATRRVAGGRLG